MPLTCGLRTYYKTCQRFRKGSASLQLCDFSYQERLAFLDLETLESRRLKSDLLMYYKILNNLTPWPADKFFHVGLLLLHVPPAKLKYDITFICQTACVKLMLSIIFFPSM